LTVFLTYVACTMLGPLCRGFTPARRLC